MGRIFVEITKQVGKLRLIWKVESRVTSSDLLVTSSNLGVTSSNPRVTSSDPRVTSWNPRDRRLKEQVARLKGREIKIFSSVFRDFGKNMVEKRYFQH